MYEVLLRGMKGGVREQKVRVPSYCIRKLLGCPLLERIFPELLESARVQRTDEQVSERLRTFRATICENDEVEVTMVTGKPFQQQSMRHAVCTRPPGTCVRLVHVTNNNAQTNMHYAARTLKQTPYELDKKKHHKPMRMFV